MKIRNDYHHKRRQVIGKQTAYRVCLQCDKRFLSEGPWNRRCPDCKDTVKIARATLCDTAFAETEWMRPAYRVQAARYRREE